MLRIVMDTFERVLKFTDSLIITGCIAFQSTLYFISVRQELLLLQRVYVITFASHGFPRLCRVQLITTSWLSLS